MYWKGFMAAKGLKIGRTLTFIGDQKNIIKEFERVFNIHTFKVYSNRTTVYINKEKYNRIKSIMKGYNDKSYLRGYIEASHLRKKEGKLMLDMRFHTEDIFHKVVALFPEKKNYHYQKRLTLYGQYDIRRILDYIYIKNADGYAYGVKREFLRIMMESEGLDDFTEYCKAFDKVPFDPKGTRPL